MAGIYKIIMKTQGGHDDMVLCGENSWCHPSYLAKPIKEMSYREACAERDRLEREAKEHAIQQCRDVISAFHIRLV